MAKNNIMSDLEKREARRKKSVLAQMADNNQKDNKVDITSDVLITNTKDKERRTKRVNLLLKPTLYEKAQNKCDDIGISFNECINQFLEKWISD